MNVIPYLNIEIQLLHWHYWIACGIGIVTTIIIASRNSIERHKPVTYLIWIPLFQLILYIAISILIAQFGVDLT